MFEDIVLVSRCLKELASDSLAEAIIESVIFTLNYHSDEISGGEYDKFMLLALLFEYNDEWVNDRYDPCKNFAINFTFSDDNSSCASE